MPSQDQQDPNEEFVNIRLSEHGQDVMPGRVTRKSYDDVWKGKGWQLVSDEDAAAASSPESSMTEPTATTRKK